MTTARSADQEGTRPRPASHREFARTRRSSLYVRVVMVNVAILLVGLLLLLWSPVTVSAPVSV